MKRLIISLVFLLASVGSVQAGKPSLSIMPTFSHGFGTTEYELNLSFFSEDNNQEIVIRSIQSLLEFPTDVFYAGIQVKLESSPQAKHYWYMQASIQRSLANPDGLMIDTDWDRVAGRFDEKFSYTESEPVMRGLLAEFELGRHIGGNPEKFSFALNAAVKYQRIVQDIDNFEGWQKPFNDATFQYGDSLNFKKSDTAALHYKVKYLMPGLGFSTTVGSIHRSFARMTFLGHVVFAKDFDDHLLRKKSSPGKGTGRGFSTSGVWHFLPVPGGSKPLFIELYANFMTLSVAGSQTQTWYGDDLASPEDDTGLSVSGIPHDFRSTQFSLGLSVGKEI